MSESYAPVEDIDSKPEYVFRIAKWLELADLKFLPLRDKRDGAYTFLLRWKDSPDYFVEIDSEGKYFSLFSNVITSLKDQEPEKIIAFWGKATAPNMQYCPVKIAYDEESGTLRAFLRLYWFEVTGELFVRLVKSVAEFLNDLAKITEELGLPEIWRETEGEPRSERKPNWDRLFA